MRQSVVSSNFALNPLPGEPVGPCMLSGTTTIKLWYDDNVNDDDDDEEEDTYTVICLDLSI